MEASKNFECNSELENILKRYGFIETTDHIDKLKGKKEFRKGKTSKTLIRFDYINFVLYEGGYGCNGFDNSTIPEEDLHLLLWYLNSSWADRQEISEGHFDLDRTRSSYKTLNKELAFYKEFGRVNRKTQKITRMLNSYNAIQLSAA